MAKIRTLGLITTGGDAPGMNTAIRAIVRYAIVKGLRVMGIHRGFCGLMAGDIEEMSLRSVGGILNRGGTILHTVRCPEFKKKSYRNVCLRQIKRHRIDALVVIGGDGSLHASREIAREWKIPVMVVPASIDNDIAFTDYSIGFDTAVNTALEAIDKIRDTAKSHERIFIVEIMGREHGFLALDVGLTAGAEVVLLPEAKFKISKVIKILKEGIEKGKTSSIVVTAEGAIRANELAKAIKTKLKFDVRVSVLGHMQRGGSPTAMSREIACKLGVAAVEHILRGKKNLMMGIKSDDVIATPIEKVVKTKRKIDIKGYKMAEILAK